MSVSTQPRQSHRTGCPRLGVHHRARSCDTLEEIMGQIELSLPASLGRKNNKGLSISLLGLPAWHTESFPYSTFSKLLSSNLITFTATNDTSPQQKQHEVTLCSSSRVSELSAGCLKDCLLTPESIMFSFCLFLFFFCELMPK